MDMDRQHGHAPWICPMNMDMGIRYLEKILDLEKMSYLEKFSFFEKFSVHSTFDT
jgi:hypothetical protein